MSKYKVFCSVFFSIPDKYRSHHVESTQLKSVYWFLYDNKLGPCNFPHSVEIGKNMELVNFSIFCIFLSRKTSEKFKENILDETYF